MTKMFARLLLLLMTPLVLLADGGVLIPRDKAQPDPGDSFPGRDGNYRPNRQR